MAIPPCRTIVAVAQKDLYYNGHETFGLGKEITCEMSCGGLPPILPVFGIVVFVLWGFRLLGCMATDHCGIERIHDILLNGWT